MRARLPNKGNTLNDSNVRFNKISSNVEARLGEINTTLKKNKGTQKALSLPKLSSASIEYCYHDDFFDGTILNWVCLIISCGCFY